MSSCHIGDILFFWMRQPHDSLQSVDIKRVQKRLIHLCAQAVEMAFHADKFPLSTQPPTVLENDTCADQSNWTASKTRNQAAEELRAELLRRFMASKSGFVAGIKHSSNQNIAGIGGSGMSDNASAMQAAAQMCTAYFLKASSALMDKFVTQPYKHLSCYYDAAAVCNFSIMELHLSCDGLVVSAPFALLPQLKQPFEKTSKECLQAIQDVDLPAPLHEISKKDEVAKKMQVCPKEKASSRIKILALNQSLQYLLNLKLSDMEPHIKLRPPKDQEKRCYHVDQQGIPRAYLWNQITKQSVWQSSDSIGIDQVLRLSCLCDEGETAGAMSLMGNGLAIMAHRDSQHKWYNELKMAASENPIINEAISATMLVLNFENGPWHSGLFGRKVRDIHTHIADLPIPNVLLDICMPGIISDLDLPHDTSQETIKGILVEYAESNGKSLHAALGGDHKLGRWGEFVDSFHRLKRVWHIRLFVLLLGCALEGTSPWAAIAGAFEDDPTETLPKVLRVSRLKRAAKTVDLQIYVHTRIVHLHTYLK